MLNVERLAGGAADAASTDPMAKDACRLPVLVVLHQEHSTSGHVGRLLRARGLPLDVRRPRFGDPLPATLAGHAGAVVFGGPMSANDDEDFVRHELALVAVALREQRPFLGICLGAQLLARELGARVSADAEGHVEIGYHTVEVCAEVDLVANSAADPVDGVGAGAQAGDGWPTRIYQWHNEGFELPAGALPMVRSKGRFREQAFRFGPAAFGLQFHPEITYAMVARWSTRGAAKLELPGAASKQKQLADHIAHGPAVLHWLDRFLGVWLALGMQEISAIDSMFAIPQQFKCKPRIAGI